jgi:hypothetical protein
MKSVYNNFSMIAKFCVSVGDDDVDDDDNDKLIIFIHIVRFSLLQI